MKKLLLSLAAIFLFLSSQAQWNPQNSMVTGSITGIHFADSNNGFAVTKTDTIVGTTDGGVTWGFNYAAGFPLYAIHCVNTNTVYACGANGSFFYTYDNGATWTQASTSQGNNLYGMYWLNKDTGWAVGLGGTIVRTYNGGSFWQVLSSGTGNTLNSVYFTDPITGYAVGDLGTAVQTIDGGSTWTAMTTGSGANLYSIYFTDSNNGYIVGQGGNVLKTTNVASTWNSMPSGTASDLLSIQFIDANNGWACGKSGTIVRTNDAGYTWYSQISGTAADLNSVCFLNPSSGFASGTLGTILQTSNAGCSGTYNVTITGADTLCAGGTTTLTANGGSTYTWSTASSSTVIVVNPGVSTSYTVTGIVPDGCAASSVATVTVYAIPGIFTSPSGIACFGQCNGATGASGSCISYTWQPGNIVAANINNLCAGNYTVTGIDIHGCVNSAISPITEPASPLSVSFSNLVNASCNGLSDGSVDGTPTGGTLPYSYQWSNGTSTSGISAVPAGDYTLVVTDVNNCQDSSIANILNQNPAPSPAISGLHNLCPGQTSQYLYVNTNGTAPFAPEWYDYSQSSTYCTLDTSLFTSYTAGPDSIKLTLSDAMGCIGTATYTLTVGVSDSLSGWITEPNSTPVSGGAVYLFRQQASHAGLLDTLGAVGIVNGAYSFPQLDYGDYFLKAIADTQAYPTAIATYYSNRTYPFQWDSALVITHHTCSGANSGPYSFSILEITPLTGPGVISGYVTAGPGYGQRLGIGGHVMGAPLKGVDVKLGRNPGGSPAARTTTDTTTGQYVFTNVPLNQPFTIYVDIPNYGMDSTLTVTLTPGDSVSSDNNYYVDSTMVRVDTSQAMGIITVKGTNIDLQVFPNPSAGKLYVEIPAGMDLEVTLFNVYGKQVMKHAMRSALNELDLSELAEGVYMIHIISGESVLSKKIILQR